MKPHVLSAPPTCCFPAIIEYLDQPVDSGSLCRLHHYSGYIDVWSWLQRHPADQRPLTAGLATTLELPESDNVYVLVDFKEDALAELSGLLHSSLCPIDGVVDQTVKMIDSLKSTALRRMMMAALLDQDAYHGYWTSPASRRHHHAYAGGLARHSLEVAIMVSSIARLTQQERETGIVGALLHDWGKIWCYGAVGREGDARRHEAIGLSRLSKPLDTLRIEDPRAAAALTEILGGPRAYPDEQYPLAIGRIVRAMDQHSCEAERVQREADEVMF